MSSYIRFLTYRMLFLQHSCTLFWHKPGCYPVQCTEYPQLDYHVFLRSLVYSSTFTSSNPSSTKCSIVWCMPSCFPRWWLVMPHPMRQKMNIAISIIVHLRSWICISISEWVLYGIIRTLSRTFSQILNKFPVSKLGLYTKIAHLSTTIFEELENNTWQNTFHSI